MVEKPRCVSKAKDWEAVCISLDSCFDETSGVESVSEEIVLQKNKIVCYRICTSVNMIHRYMPYKYNVFHNVYFDNMVSQIYPSELHLNKDNTSDTEVAFLDLHLSISNDIV